MKNEVSIRTRLSFWYTAVLSFGLILFACTVWLALRRTLHNDLAAALQNQARGFEEYLHIEEQDPTVNLEREIDEYSRSWLEDHLLVVYDGANRLIYSNVPADSEWLRRREPGAASDEPRTLIGKHARYVALQRNFPLRHGTFRTFLAISLRPSDQAINRLGWLLAITVPLFTVCAASGGYLLSRKALLPINRIIERARSIGVGDLSERLEVRHTKDELQRLTETWNGMLERLESAVSKISRFTADASHELRTPVAIIRLAAENALRKSRDEDGYRAALLQIQRESENMTNLIGDLLFLTRGDVDSAPHFQPVALDELVRDVCDDVNDLVAAKHIALAQSFPIGQILIAGDVSGLRRMVLALFDNALKYVPEGGCIWVRLEKVDDEVQLHVVDNGPGIPEELKHQIFERFFRVDPSRNKSSGGYGLGLAIAQAIAKQHKGAIEERGEMSSGSHFLVSLPLV